MDILVKAKRSKVSMCTFSYLKIMDELNADMEMSHFCGKFLLWQEIHLAIYFG